MMEGPCADSEEKREPAGDIDTICGERSENGFRDFGTVVGKSHLMGHRLDDVTEIAVMDFLKIDAQGAELTILSNAPNKLAETVAVQVEVSFVPLYEKQPTIGVLDQTLRELGFIPHCFVEIKRWPISPALINGNSRTTLNQLLEADLGYVRDFRQFDSMTGAQWKHLALIAHHCYGSFDMALRAVTMLAKAGIISANGPDFYMQHLRSGSGIDIRST